MTGVYKVLKSNGWWSASPDYESELGVWNGDFSGLTWASSLHIEKASNGLVFNSISFYARNSSPYQIYVEYTKITD
jgi:hypothetical protein